MISVCDGCFSMGSISYQQKGRQWLPRLYFLLIFFNMGVAYPE